MVQNKVTTQETTMSNGGDYENKKIQQKIDAGKTDHRQHQQSSDAGTEGRTAISETLL
jgi:hypothetical protein